MLVQWQYCRQNREGLDGAECVVLHAGDCGRPATTCVCHFYFGRLMLQLFSNQEIRGLWHTRYQKPHSNRHRRLGSQQMSSSWCPMHTAWHCLTAWTAVRLEKFLVPQVLEKFLTFYRTPEFITVSTTVSHLCPSRPILTQSPAILSLQNTF
jgi:hypothetical protein